MRGNSISLSHGEEEEEDDEEEGGGKHIKEHTEIGLGLLLTV